MNFLKICRKPEPFSHFQGKILSKKGQEPVKAQSAGTLSGRFSCAELCQQQRKDFLLPVGQPIDIQHFPIFQTEQIVGGYVVKNGELNQHVKRGGFHIIFIPADRRFGKIQPSGNLILREFFLFSEFAEPIAEIIDHTNIPLQDKV